MSVDPGFFVGTFKYLSSVATRRSGQTLEGEILRLSGFANRYSQVKWIWLTFGDGGSKVLEFAASLSLAAASR